MNESQETQPKPEAGLPLGAAPCSAAFDEWCRNTGVGKGLHTKEIKLTNIYRAWVAGWNAANTDGEEQHAMMNGPRIAQSLPREYLEALLRVASQPNQALTKPRENHEQTPLDS